MKAIALGLNFQWFLSSAPGGKLRNIESGLSSPSA